MEAPAAAALEAALVAPVAVGQVEAIAEAVVAVVVVAEVVVEAEEVPASANTLAHRKAKRFRKNQRESLYPHLAGDHCGDLPIPTHSHL